MTAQRPPKPPAAKERSWASPADAAAFASDFASSLDSGMCGTFCWIWAGTAFWMVRLIEAAGLSLEAMVS
jgi:hypothetical protein